MHELLKFWFEQVAEWGYLGVFLLMALESTIFPIPSEVIVPPAAYWAAQGRFSMAGIIFAGAAGSTFGSSLMYGFALAVGRPFVVTYGRYFLLPPDKLAFAERWLADYALIGIFFARLLPVLRHLIGFPAGLVRVPFWSFAATTFVGSLIWTAILAWAGAVTLGQHPELLSDPEGLGHVIKDELVWFVLFAALLGAAFIGVKAYAMRVKTA